MQPHHSYARVGLSFRRFRVGWFDASVGPQGRTVISEAPPKAGKREWIGLAVIALPCLLYSMDLTVLPAREAFLRGLVVSEVVSGVGTLVLAVFAWVTFRRVGVAAD